ncbi:MAG TPA: HAD-IC family P-type ATPase, partial [Candidatus Peribacteria bacterium]|nr:HAD-IC family P-type ATPase [Candidatus Peribacteria bacterium]
IVLGLCLAIFFLGLAKGMKAIDIFFTAVSLAVAAVPEGLPAIVTICLAIGVQRMIKKNALIRRLDAIETLGNITVICADKTGTMTENQMKVVGSWVPQGGDEALLARVGASCNRAELPNIGDPTEIALLVHAEEKGVKRLPIAEEDVPFTSENKYMITSHEYEGKTVKYCKGAVEMVVELVKGADTKAVMAQNEAMAKQGLRVLAMAADTGSGLQLVGLIAMVDPPRKGVREAIGMAKKAGIRTVMITGDNPVTAGHIAQQVGLETSGVIDGKQLEEMDLQQLQHALKTVSVFARVQPVHKVKILEAFQSLGQIVAMSGDGVNDAPALKRSHVGIAMGLRGTDVARESGAMVLTDDNYATIVAAIGEGRRIYDNIRKFIIFLLRSNVGEVLLIATAMLINFPLPLLPLHILWVNLVTDSFPALALAAEKAEPNIMSRPPRKKGENVLTGEISLLFVAGLFNAGLSLWVFWWLEFHLGSNLMLARTGALTTTIVFQCFLALSTRMKGTVFHASPFGNPWLLGAIGLSLGLHLILLYSPLGTLFNVLPMPAEGWGLILGTTFAGFIGFEICKVIRNKLVHG